MGLAAPKINYLQVSHIPFQVDKDGTIITDEMWANDLHAVAKSVGPLTLAAPELPLTENQVMWGPTSVRLQPDGLINFVGFPPLASWRDYWKLPKIRRILKKEVEKADLVHTSNLFAPYLVLSYAHDLAVSMGKKTLYVVSEDFSDMLEWEWVRLASTTFDRYFREYTLHKMNKRAMQTARTASMAFLATPPAVNIFRLDTQNGVAIRDTTHAPEDVITETDLQRKCAEIEGGAPLVIAAACRHKPLKGLDFLVRAAAELKSRKIPVKVMIYGHGPLTPSLKKLSEELQVSDIVSFPGILKPGKELYSAISKAHIFAMPHRTNDFARAFYDAMTGGTPVIAFHTPSSQGTLREGVDGILVPLDNVITLAMGIERLHHDRKLLARLSGAARQRALMETQEVWHRYRAERIRELFNKS